MFNVHEVKSTIAGDQYGFTQKLIAFINESNAPPPDSDILDKLIVQAFKEMHPESQQIVHNALFLIYQTNLAHPRSHAAHFQHNAILINFKNLIEAHWLNHEFRGIDNTHLDNQKLSQQLIHLWKNHNASHHAIFDFLEREATPEQLYLFFKSDSALNLIFFDLVAYTLIGAEPQTRGTISENLWDEIGHGDNYFTHVNLYKNVLARRDISLPDNHHINLYGPDALSGHNAFMLGAVNRKHYYKMLGVMAMTEVLDPPQYAKLVKGCLRLGMLDKDVHYYSEHITIDIKHGDDWLNKVIDVIAEKDPDSKRDFHLGCILRLNTAERYYDNLLCEMLKLKEL